MKITKVLAVVRITILTILLFGITPQLSHAVGAYPWPIQVTQPDGSVITIRMHGDEVLGYATTEDGHLVATKSDGYYYYADYNTGSLKVSNMKVGNGMTRFAMSKGISNDLVARIRQERIYNNNRGSSPKRNKGFASVSSPTKVLVVLAEYQDVKFNPKGGNPQEEFTKMMNDDNYNYEGALASVATYYKENSNGVYTPPEFVVSNVVTLPNFRDYYSDETTDAMTGPEKVARQLAHIKDALTAVQNQVKFDDFATGGKIDMVLLYYAGHNAAEGNPNTVWPHKWNMDPTGGIYKINGIIIDEYACTSELRGRYSSSNPTAYNRAGIGTMCHEFTHVLGLADIYNTQRISQQSTGVECWGSASLMNSGNYNNDGRTPPALTAYERIMLGWLIPEDIKTPGEYTLGKINDNKAYRIPTDVEGEFFLLENRQRVRWDEYIANYDENSTVTLEKGLLLWHMDHSKNKAYGENTAAHLWSINAPNAAIDHLCADVEESGGRSDRSTTMSNIYFPGAGNVTSITHNTAANIKPWSGKDLGIEITNIRKVGEDIVFNVKMIDRTKMNIRGVVSNTTGSIINGVTVSFYDNPNPQESDTPVHVVTSSNRGEFTWLDIPITKDYTIMINHPGYQRYETTVTGSSGIHDITIAMLAYTESSFPGILLKQNYVVGEGVLPEIQNIDQDKVQAIVYKMDGVEIPATKFYTFASAKAYTLVAEITYKDGGGVETITRKITVK